MRLDVDKSKSQMSASVSQRLYLNLTEVQRAISHLRFVKNKDSLHLWLVYTSGFGFLFNCTTVGQASDSMA